MEQKTVRFTLKNSFTTIFLVVIVALFTYLLGSWATYPTSRHQAIVQEQKDFLKRNGLFSGSKEFEDLNNTPEAKYSRVVGGISSFAQYIVYVAVLIIVYRYIRQRRRKAIVVTSLIVSGGSLLATAIIVGLSGNLNNVILEIQSSSIVLVGTITIFTLVTLGIVAIIELVYNKISKDKQLRLVDTAKTAQKKLDEGIENINFKKIQSKLIHPFTAAAVIILSIMIGWANNVSLHALNSDGTCNQQEYTELHGDCTLSQLGSSPAPTNQTSDISQQSASASPSDMVQATFAIKSNSADKPEGNSGTTAYTFTVTRSGNLSGTSSVDWYIQTGTRATPKSNKVFFNNGESSKVITLNVTGDTTFQPDEFFSVCLGATSNAGILQNNSCANGVIRNDDSAGPCGYVSKPTVAMACVASVAHRGIDNPVAVTIKGFFGVTSQLIGGVSRIFQPSPTKKILVTMGDSYEVGIPKTCSKPGSCDSLFKTLIGPGVLAGIYKTGVKLACFRQDYTSTDLTVSSLNNKKDVLWSANNVACAGSKSSQMLNGWTWFANPKLPPVPSQLDALNGSDIGLVVVSAGGNDVLVPEQGETGIFDCTGKLLCDSGSEVHKTVYAKLDKLYNRQSQSGDIVNFYEAIRKKTEAPVLAEGYPVYFGDKQFSAVKEIISTSRCQQLRKRKGPLPNDCYSITYKYVNEAPGCEYFEDVERELGREIVHELNGRIKEAVKYMNDKYGSNQFIYIDPFSSGRFDYTKENVCAISQTKPITGPKEFTPFPAHPNANGVQKRSQQVVETYFNYQNKNNPLAILLN